MCNLYSMTRNKDAIRDLFKVDKDDVVGTNWPPMTGIFPNYKAPVIRQTEEGRELFMAYWGMPNPPQIPGYSTNIRNTGSPHWRRWTTPASRCLVPVTSFSEYAPEPDPVTKKKDIVWFALSQERPLFAFAGIWAEWNGSRGPAKNPTVSGPHLAYAFLTTAPNAVVEPIHPKAMPVILHQDDWETWLTAEPKVALRLQRPWPDDLIQIVARGPEKEDLAA